MSHITVNRHFTDLTILTDNECENYEFVILDTNLNTYLVYTGSLYRLPAVNVEYNSTYSDAVKKHIKELFPHKNRDIFFIRNDENVTIVVILRKKFLKLPKVKRKKQKLYYKMKLDRTPAYRYFTTIVDILRCFDENMFSQNI